MSATTLQLARLRLFQPTMQCRTFIRPTQVLFVEKKKSPNNAKGGNTNKKGNGKIGSKQKSPGFKKRVADGDSKSVESNSSRGAPRLIKVDHPLFQNQPSSPTLPNFEPESLTQGAIGSALALPAQRDSALRVFGVPKTLQQELYHLPTPFSVVRGVTMTALEDIDKASTKSSLDSRIVLTGPSGCGKSVLLLQIVNYCAARNWVVLYIPQAIDFLLSTSSYTYSPATRTYHQPALARQLLQQLSEFNSSILPTITTQEDRSVEGVGSIPKGTNLSELARVGVRDDNLAVPVLRVVFEELGKQNSHPVLLAIDSFQAFFNPSQYRDPLYNKIQAHHLSVPRLMLEYAGGIKSFARGAVVGALSTTNTSFPTPLDLSEALFLSSGGPYDKRSKDLQVYTKGLRPIHVPSSLSVDEAASVFEVWTRSRALHTAPSDDLFLSKYTETGGNAREFVRSGLLGTLASF